MKFKPTIIHIGDRKKITNDALLLWNKLKTKNRNSSKRFV